MINRLNARFNLKDYNFNPYFNAVLLINIALHIYTRCVIFICKLLKLNSLLSNQFIRFSLSMILL